MSKRKLLSEISKRHYQRLKRNKRNIVSAENTYLKKLSTDFVNIDGLDDQNSSSSSNSSNIIFVSLLDSLQRIERMLADIKCDINHLTEQYQLILTKLDLNVSNRTQKYRSPTPNDELSKLSFPLQTVEKIESLQCILASNEGLREHMLDILATIGGSSYEEMSKRMFIYVFTNEVANLYSWMGGKGKYKLHHLDIMKLMYKVVRKTFSNITKKNFETNCKDWFRHAKHRFENEKRRQNNSTKTNNKYDQQATKVRDNEATNVQDDETTNMQDEAS